MKKILLCVCLLNVAHIATIGQNGERLLVFNPTLSADEQVERAFALERSSTV